MSAADVPWEALYAAHASDLARYLRRGTYGNWIVGFRSDGSAVLTASVGGGSPPGSNVIVVDIASGTTKQIDLGGAFVAAVRLR